MLIYCYSAAVTRLEVDVRNLADQYSRLHDVAAAASEETNAMSRAVQEYHNTLKSVHQHQSESKDLLLSACRHGKDDRQNGGSAIRRVHSIGAFTSRWLFTTGKYSIVPRFCYYSEAAYIGPVGLLHGYLAKAEKCTCLFSYLRMPLSFQNEGTNSSATAAISRSTVPGVHRYTSLSSKMYLRMFSSHVDRL